MRYLAFVFIIAFCCDAKYIPEDGIYSVAENMPEYEAGMVAFQDHIDATLSSTEAVEAGSVFVSFVVTTEGKLKEIKVVKSLNDQQDELAIQAVKTAPLNWKPGIDAGKLVNVKMVYPIHFNN